MAQLSYNHQLCMSTHTISQQLQTKKNCHLICNYLHYVVTHQREASQRLLSAHVCCLIHPHVSIQSKQVAQLLRAAALAAQQPKSRQSYCRLLWKGQGAC